MNSDFIMDNNELRVYVMHAMVAKRSLMYRKALKYWTFFWERARERERERANKTQKYDQPRCRYIENWLWLRFHSWMLKKRFKVLSSGHVFYFLAF